MKKIFLIAGLLAFVTAQADWLFWTINESDVSDSGIADVVGAQIGYTAGSPAAGTIIEHNYAPLVEGGGPEDFGQQIPVVPGAYGEKGAVAVDLTSISSASTYSYYIELLNSSGEVVGRSTSATTYTQLSSYIGTGDIGDVPQAGVWHGGSFEAVPEPSSMALLALGAGLVGLRRKLRKAKKEKRA